MSQLGERRFRNVYDNVMGGLYLCKGGMVLHAPNDALWGSKCRDHLNILVLARLHEELVNT